MAKNTVFITGRQIFIDNKVVGYGLLNKRTETINGFRQTIKSLWLKICYRTSKRKYKSTEICGQNTITVTDTKIFTENKVVGLGLLNKRTETINGFGWTIKSLWGKIESKTSKRKQKRAEKGGLGHRYRNVHGEQSCRSCLSASTYRERKSNQNSRSVARRESITGRTVSITTRLTSTPCNVATKIDMEFLIRAGHFQGAKVSSCRIWLS